MGCISRYTHTTQLGYFPTYWFVGCTRLPHFPHTPTFPTLWMGRFDTFVPHIPTPFGVPFIATYHIRFPIYPHLYPGLVLVDWTEPHDTHTLQFYPCPHYTRWLPRDFDQITGLPGVPVIGGQPPPFTVVVAHTGQAVPWTGHTRSDSGEDMGRANWDSINQLFGLPRCGIVDRHPPHAPCTHATVLPLPLCRLVHAGSRWCHLPVQFLCYPHRCITHVASYATHTTAPYAAVPICHAPFPVPTVYHTAHAPQRAPFAGCAPHARVNRWIATWPPSAHHYHPPTTAPPTPVDSLVDGLWTVLFWDFYTARCAGRFPPPTLPYAAATIHCPIPAYLTCRHHRTRCWPPPLRVLPTIFTTYLPPAPCHVHTCLRAYPRRLFCLLLCTPHLLPTTFTYAIRTLPADLPPPSPPATCHIAYSDIAH